MHVYVSLFFMYSDKTYMVSIRSVFLYLAKPIPIVYLISSRCCPSVIKIALTGLMFGTFGPQGGWVTENKP